MMLKATVKETCLKTGPLACEFGLNVQPVTSNVLTRRLQSVGAVRIMQTQLSIVDSRRFKVTTSER